MGPGKLAQQRQHTVVEEVPVERASGSGLQPVPAGLRSLSHRDRKEHLEAGTPWGAAWGGGPEVEDVSTEISGEQPRTAVN